MCSFALFVCNCLQLLLIAFNCTVLLCFVSFDSPTSIELNVVGEGAAWHWDWWKSQGAGGVPTALVCNSFTRHSKCRCQSGGFGCCVVLCPLSLLLSLCCWIELNVPCAGLGCNHVQDFSQLGSVHCQTSCWQGEILESFGFFASLFLSLLLFWFKLITLV